ncbi:hypothetical protein [Desulforhopalus sp. IMCC35007]|uniref:hypothetical protein n=1 Tax=Desulforhopalus sp. IMCC35007 TaxID=2569543 RepID=UPI0010AE9766|nr:hypothetical protein [Desulforhopalus sp. IMCC35007]TKB09591.1 hypothetical protein FCL48_09060 [Desulforhopalus sp. IMCC35007]
MNVKRVHFSCDEDVHDKLESLKHLQGLKRDEILSDAINDRFKQVIAGLAAKEGLIQKSSVIELKRADYVASNTVTVFDEICESLNLKGEDGLTSSISTITLEIKNASAT